MFVLAGLAFISGDSTHFSKLRSRETAPLGSQKRPWSNLGGMSLSGRLTSPDESAGTLFGKPSRGEHLRRLEILTWVADQALPLRNVYALTAGGLIRVNRRSHLRANRRRSVLYLFTKASMITALS